MCTFPFVGGDAVVHRAGTHAPDGKLRNYRAVVLDLQQRQVINEHGS